MAQPFLAVGLSPVGARHNLPRPGRDRAPQLEQSLASLEKLIACLTSNPQKFFRYLYIPQLLAGLFLLGLAYFIGHDHYHLIREGVRVSGTIVGYQQQQFVSSSRNTTSTSTGYMPIVEFQARDRLVQFKDWLGARISGSTNIPVVVLYDPANPSLAMIDRPTWNWLPWAPILAVGLFLVLVGINGFFRSQRTSS